MNTIHHLPIDEVRSGPCHICHGSTLLQFQDRSTTLRFGRCCLSEMLSANAALSVNNQQPKPDHEVHTR